MKKIIVLGASGFLGSSLLDKLKDEKFQVKSMIHSNNVDIKSKKFKGNVLVKSFIDKEITKGDIVINLVGQYSENFSNFVDINLIGGLNLLDSCVKKKISRIILISTMNIYGENLKRPSKETDIPKPEDPYGEIKFATEKIYESYSKIFGIDITILRLSHVYGPHKKIGIISDLLNSVNKNKRYTLFNNGKQLRDFLYVDDAVDGIIKTINFQTSGFRIFNISSGIRYSIKDLVKLIEKITNKKMKINLNSKIPDERCIWADNLKAKKILKFKPKIDIKKGLSITYEYISKLN
jgi:nucleoside-diphosphate-sugar epimerase